MPVYNINMQGDPSAQAWADASEALVKLATPDYKGMADAKIAGARAEQAYAGADANRALARERNAQAVRAETFNTRFNEISAQLAQEGYTPEELAQLRTEAAYEFGILDGTLNPGNIGDFNLAMTPFGEYDDGDIAGFQIGAGIEPKFAQTIDPETGQAVLTHSRSAGGARPVLSETDAKGLAMQTADPNAAPAFGGMEGTGFDQQAVNFITHMNVKRQRGEQWTPEEEFQYGQLFYNMYGQPKPTMVDNGDGTKTLRMIQQSPPPGIYNPFAEPETPISAPSGVETPSPQLGPTIEAAAALEAAQGASGDATLQPGETVGTVKPPKLTEGASRLATLGGAMGESVMDMFEETGYDFETDTWIDGGQWPTAWDDAARWVEERDFPLAGFAGRSMRGDFGNAMRRLTFNVVEPILRLRTGAAAPDSEKLAYDLGLLPQSGLSDIENQTRMRTLKRHVEIYAATAEQMGVNPDAIFDPNFYATEMGVRIREAAKDQIEAMEVEAPADPTGTGGAPDAELENWRSKYGGGG